MLYIVNLMVVFFLGASPTVEWSNLYDWLETDMAHDVCCDSSGNVVVVGETKQEFDVDCWIISLSKTGDSLWSVMYGEDLDEYGVGIATTRPGSIAFATTVIDGDNQKIATILLNQNHQELWRRENVSSSTVEATSITASIDDKIYTVGNYDPPSTINPHYTLDGYDYDGNQPIQVNEGSGHHKIGGLVTNRDGNVFLGGDMRVDCIVYSFTSQGEFQWWELYDQANCRGFGIAANEASHLFQSGDVFTPSGTDFLLLKWLPSDTGAVIVWPDSTHKAYDLGFDEYCRDIKLDGISDCYLAGWQVRGEEEDVALVKTDSAGNMLWSWVYEQEGGQEIEAIEVDSEGYIYLAGSHHNGANWDMLVMQVRQPLTISGRITDTVGASMSGVPVKLSGDTTVEVVSDTDGFYSIEVYNGGNYVVTPQLGGWGFLPSSYTYSPLAHRELNQNFSGEYTAIAEPDTPVTPVTHQSLEVTASTIYYALPDSQQGVISIYDASGQLIERMVVAGSGSVGLPVLPSGVYFVRLDAGHSVLTEKVNLSLR